MIEAIFGPSTPILEKSLQLRMLRQGMLASNIANAETPNYRAVDIDFRATMENLIGAMREGRPPLMELERAHPRHFTHDLLAGHLKPSPRIVFAAGDSHSIGNDSNSVNLERQLGRMQINAMHHAVVAKLLARKLAGIKSIVESTSRY